jgi:hypothetical protein
MGLTFALYLKRNDMSTYKSTKANQYSNRIVSELNAVVCTATFSSTDGQQKADLYSCKNSNDVLVAHGSCAPINSTFVGSVLISFE